MPCLERFTHTINTRLSTYMKAKASSRWGDVLPEMMHLFNLRRHRLIGMAPANEQNTNEYRLWGRLYCDETTIRKRIIGVPNNIILCINKSKILFDKITQDTLE